MVMQDVNHQLFTESVKDELTLNLPENSRKNVNHVISILGLSGYKDSHPLSLSGGQKQRVAIASEVCAEKDFLIYDEPTSGQDYENMKSTCKIISMAAKNAVLSFIITHDLEFILGCCTSVLQIDAGIVCDYYPLNAEGINKVKHYFAGSEKREVYEV